MHSWRFEAIGTHWEIESPQAFTPEQRERVGRIIAAFDATWSRFRDDSVVSALRERGGSVRLDADAAADATALLEIYRRASAATCGAVSPLIGAGLEALGYDRELSLRAGEPAAAPRGWEQLLRMDAGALELDAPAVIDIGAAGKGRLVDLVSDALGDAVGRVTVDGSGDLRVRGGAVRVALEHPYDPTRAVGVVEVADAALCASAVTRRAWGDGLHHVLDGRTGLPVRRWAATWALAPTAMRADALATALFFDGGTDLAAEWGAEWVRMSTDGRVECSAGFAGELFTAPG